MTVKGRNDDEGCECHHDAEDAESDDVLNTRCVECSDDAALAVVECVH
jgi:hypothetical protein